MINITKEDILRFLDSVYLKIVYQTNCANTFNSTRRFHGCEKYEFTGLKRIVLDNLV